MEHVREGHHSGLWQLKSSIAIPSDDELLKLVIPEAVVLNESMQVGQRYLEDAGFGKAVGNTANEAEAEEDASNLEIEQQLAPWSTTKNFIAATQGKAMLALWGEGDPTGRGEAFSFVRISMKGNFVRAADAGIDRSSKCALNFGPECTPEFDHR